MRQPEVGEPEFSATVKEKVGGLDVAVEDSLIVRVLQSLCGLRGQSDNGSDIIGRLNVRGRTGNLGEAAPSKPVGEQTTGQCNRVDILIVGRNSAVAQPA